MIAVDRPCPLLIRPLHPLRIVQLVKKGTTSYLNILLTISFCLSLYSLWEYTARASQEGMAEWSTGTKQPARELVAEGDIVLICAPFHSISNAPVGMPYLSAFLENKGIECPLIDLNIEARDFLMREPCLGPTASARRDVLDDMFSLGRRTHLAELLAWSWLDPDGLDGVIRRVTSHPSPLIRQFWVEQGLNDLYARPQFVTAGAILREWLDQKARQLAAQGTDWIGFSAVITNLAPTLYLARTIRELNPDVLLILGGAHLNQRNASQMLGAFPFFDAVIPAPAYLPVADVILTHQAKKPLAGIPGIWTWNGRRGEDIVQDQTRRWINLDLLPPANWGVLPLSLYESGFRLKNSSGDFSKWYPTIPVQTSRGCSFSKCNFCHNVTDYPKYRMQTPKRVADEIQHQIQSVGTRGFFFTDDEFVGSTRRTLEICDQLIELREDVRFFCWLRLDSFDLPLLEKMYAAGARQLFIGCEAVDDDLLRLMNKGYDAQLALRQLNLLYDFWTDHGDFTYVFNLIVDYPGERLESVRNTAAIIEEDPQLFHGRVAACCRFHLYEGTPEYGRLRESALGCLEGLLPPQTSVPSFRYFFPRESHDTGERMSLWNAIAQFVLFPGGRDLAGKIHGPSLIYD